MVNSEFNLFCCHASPDYIPIVSTVVGVKELALKCLQFFSAPSVTSEPLPTISVSYVQNAQNKHLGRTLLMLIPVLGNLLILLGDQLLSCESSAMIYMSKFHGNLCSLSEDLQSNGMFLFKIVKDNPQVIQQFTEKHLNNYDFQSAISGKYYLFSPYIHTIAASDQNISNVCPFVRHSDFMQNLILQCGEALYLTNNNSNVEQTAEMCCAAIKKNLMALKYVRHDLLQNPDILQAIKDALSRSNTEVVPLWKSYGSVIREHSEILQWFLQHTPSLFWDLPKEMQEQEVYLVAAADKWSAFMNDYLFVNLPRVERERMMEKLIPIVQNKLLCESGLHSWKMVSRLFAYLVVESQYFKRKVFTQEFWMQYIERNPDFDISQYLKWSANPSDMDLVLTVVRALPSIINKFCNYVYIDNNFCIKNLSKEQAEQIVQEAIRFGLSWRDFKSCCNNVRMDKIADSKEWMLLFVQQDGLNLQHVSTTLQDDEEFVRTAVAQNINALGHASDRLRDDTPFIRSLLEAQPRAYVFASERVQEELGKKPPSASERLWQDRLCQDRSEVQKILNSPDLLNETEANQLLVQEFGQTMLAFMNSVSESISPEQLLHAVSSYLHVESYKKARIKYHPDQVSGRSRSLGNLYQLMFALLETMKTM